MKRQVSVALLLISFSASGQDMAELGRNVVGIEVRRAVFEKVGTNVVQVLHGKADGSVVPKLDIGQGTGFFVMHNARSYVVTAKHVPLGSGDASLFLISRDGNRVSLELEKIRQAEPSAKWFFHPKADVAVHPYAWSVKLDVVNLNFPESSLRTNELPLLEPVACAGFPFGAASEAFPHGIGVARKLSPIAAECKIASWLTELPEHPSELLFILLDRPLAQGYSGAPIYTRQNILRGGGIVMEAGFRPEIIGLCSGAMADVQGGKLAIIVPSSYILEVFQLPEFLEYEKALEARKR